MSVKPSEQPHIFHFHNIGKFKKNSVCENRNIKEQRQNTGK